MQNSIAFFNEAKSILPGGVNSPVRSFSHVGSEPRYLQRGEGAYVYDEDGKAYIDYVGSWGPMIAGHANPRVIKAVQEASSRGLGFGANTAIEIDMARKIQQHFPSMQMLRMVNSGTEATLSALRLARGFTDRDKILKFEGCYHGHHDALLIKAGSGALTFGKPSSAGIPESVTRDTLVARFNDLDQVNQIFKEMGNKIACVIVEPIAGNMGCIPPVPGFLEGLRTLCTAYQSLLIFDEVMTGFRVSSGGAQALYKIEPDITTLSKIIGGGLPVGAYGGKQAIMEYISPLGPVYQAGTLSGNPITLAAGLATIQETEKPGFYEAIEKNTARIAMGLKQLADRAGLPNVVNHVCGMFSLFFSDQTQVCSLDEVMACDIERFKKFFHGMLEQGVYLAPSAFEASFVSSTHQLKEIDRTLEVAEGIIKTL